MNRIETDRGRPSPPFRYPVANGTSRALSPGDTQNVMETHARLWKIVWALSLCMIFEVNIRGIGQTIPPAPIRILSGFWLSDLGLLLPILVMLVTGQFGSALLRNRGLMVCAVAVVYGLLIGLIRGNWFSAITADVRIVLALVSGLCLVEIVPKRLSSLARSMVVVSALAICLAVLIGLLSPMTLEILAQRGIPTASSAFVVIGLSICLVAPGIILSSWVESRSFSALGWLSLGMAILACILVLRTRTMSFVFIGSAFAAIVGIVVLARLPPMITTNIVSKKRRSTVGYALLFLVIIVSVMVWQDERVRLFADRLQSPMQFGVESDINLVFRIDEARYVLEHMGWADHLIGMGLGVQLSDFELSSDSIAALHIGVLNLWWRLGVILFLAVAILFLVSVVHYLRSLGYLLHRPPIEAPLTGPAMTSVICTPGIIALGMAAVISGGWAITPMLSLGMLWGLQRALTSGEWQLLRKRET